MATNCHSGYPLKWFKDQNMARDSWECAICLEILQDPVQVRDCGHQFCALCIDDILKTDPRCPTCRIELSKAMIFEDHAARRLIKKLNVNCCNEGCNWVGDLASLLEVHQNSCNVLFLSGSNVTPDVAKIEEKLEAIVLKVALLEEKHKKDIEEEKLKRQNDILELTAKYENEIRQVKAKLEEKEKKLREQMAYLGSFADTSMQSLDKLKLNPSVTIALKINNFTRKLYQAKLSKSYGDILSDAFYTSHGYRVRIEVNLNEAPGGDAGYMGAYLSLMKGENDDNLKWPFSKRVRFIVVDQQYKESQVNNFEKILIPEGEDDFHKPKIESNDAFGYSRFVLHSTLRTRQYVLNHTLYLAVAFDP